MWILTVCAVLSIVTQNTWSLEQKQEFNPWYDESRCKIGVIEKNAEGKLQCCIKLPHFNKQCFEMYPNEHQEHKIERLKEWVRDDLCEYGDLFKQGNSMFCCREDDDSLDRPCELVPYIRIPNNGLNSVDELIFNNGNLKQISEVTKFSRPMYCYLPPVNAPFACLAYIERFFYNSVTEECEKFIYGGCKGTENNFKSMEDCIAKCMLVVDIGSENT